MCTNPKRLRVPRSWSCRRDQVSWNRWECRRCHLAIRLSWGRCSVARRRPLLWWCDEFESLPMWSWDCSCSCIWGWVEFKVVRENRKPKLPSTILQNPWRYRWILSQQLAHSRRLWLFMDHWETVNLIWRSFLKTNSVIEQWILIGDVITPKLSEWVCDNLTRFWTQCATHSIPLNLEYSQFYESRAYLSQANTISCDTIRELFLLILKLESSTCNCFWWDEFTIVFIILYPIIIIIARCEGDEYKCSVAYNFWESEKCGMQRAHHDYS